MIENMLRQQRSEKLRNLKRLKVITEIGSKERNDTSIDSDVY